MKATFWGVRGSIPSPITPAAVKAKVQNALALIKHHGYTSIDDLPFNAISTHGGNTTCVEVHAGENQFILDMGTGARELGKAQLTEAFATKKLSGVILQSHVHWDHIQGFPFWAPLYLPRRLFKCDYRFFGGKSWDSQLDLVYRGQMSPPQFPVNLAELEATAMHMKFETIYDGWEAAFLGPRTTDVFPPPTMPVAKVLARKLNHPQETFGYRIENEDGKVIVFTTDHEPYAAGLPRPLLELVQGADLWITDCQYTHDSYIGKGGVQKMGWGHSYPEYIAAVGKEAKPKKIVTTHHDPDADDLNILGIANKVADLSQIETSAAWEGLVLEV